MSTLQNRLKVLLAIGCLALMMTGCRNSVPSLIEDDPTLPRQVPGAKDELVLAMEKRLDKQGVHVMMMGDDYLISIPSASLFGNQSPRLTWQSYGILNEVACYLRLYRKVSVQVTTYVTPYGSIDRQNALSLARSKAVANYLWSQNIESRLVVAYGLGSQKPIVLKPSKRDSALDSRVEITFRRVEA